MRTISIVILCFLAACSGEHKNEIVPATEITVIRDLTDSFALEPLPDPILGIYDFAHMPDQRANLRSVLITDMKLNPVQDIALESGKATDDNNENDDIRYRERIIYSFQDAVRRALTDFPKQYRSESLGRSECFATVASELERLSISKASRRILIVFSDLQENEEAFSCYSEEGQQLLANKPYKVIQILQKRHRVPRDLVGVTVYLVYQPLNREQDMQFEKMVAIYQQLLKASGARVVIQATNKQYQP